MVTTRYYVVINKNKNNKYRFELYYCGKQEMGYSKEYDSSEKCRNALDEFKEYIIHNNIKDECNYLKVFKSDDNKSYTYQFIDDNNEILYTSRKIETKTNCIKSMKSTCKNICHADVKEIKE